MLSVLRKVFLTPKSPKGDFLTRWFSIVTPFRGQGVRTIENQKLHFRSGLNYYSLTKSSNFSMSSATCPREVAL
jgi:hypothetical protein